MSLGIKSIEELLGDKTSYLLDHVSTTISKDRISLPSATFVDDIWSLSDRNNRVLGNLQRLYDNGRLGGTGYLSILPVDQGIEHSAGASFAPNPEYLAPQNIVELAIESSCHLVASIFGVLGALARNYAHKVLTLVMVN